MNDQWWERPSFAAVAVLLSLLPLVALPMPPLLDVPGHMARYHVMLGGNDAALLSQWFTFAWKPIGYLGADLLVAGLAPSLGLEFTVKLIALAIPALTAVGILWISREAHGRVQPLALLALPLAYNFAFLWGFLNFTLSIALALNAFALWLWLGRTSHLHLRAALFFAIAWLIWTAHLFGWLVLGILAYSAELIRQRDNGRAWVKAGWNAIPHCLPLAFPFFMFLSWLPSDGNAQSDYLPSLLRKPSWFAMAFRDRWPWFDIGAAVVVIIVLYRALRSKDRCVARPLMAAAIGLFLFFVALPFGSAYIDARLAPYVLTLAILAIRVPAREQRLLALISLAFFITRTAGTSVSLWIESGEWRRQVVALDHVPRGARVAAFITNSCPQNWHAELRNHLPSLAIVRRSAFANDQFVLGSTGLMQVIAPGVAGYAADPSQIVTVQPCPGARHIRTLDTALASLPRAAFDYVWLIDPAPFDHRLTAGMTPIWRDGTSVLYRIR